MAVSGAERLVAGEHAENKPLFDAFIEACVVHFGLSAMMGSVSLNNVGREFGRAKDDVRIFIETLRGKDLQKLVTATSGGDIRLGRFFYEADPSSRTSSAQLKPSLSQVINKILIKVYEEPAVAAAHAFVAEVRSLIEKNGRAVVCFSTGGTMAKFYETLRSVYGKETFWENVIAFNQDEYVGLSSTHPRSYRFEMTDQLYNHVGIKKENIHGIDGTVSECKSEALRYSADIEASGGFDLIVLGIGKNGHIGFNEPRSPFKSDVRPVLLTEQTRKDNARFFNDDIDQVPKRAITIGLATTVAAKKVFLIAIGEGKNEAVHATIFGEPTPVVPASVLREHPDVTFFLDTHAFSFAGRASSAGGGNQIALNIAKRKLEQARAAANLDFSIELKKYIIAAEAFLKAGDRNMAVATWFEYADRLTEKIVARLPAINPSSCKVRGESRRIAERMVDGLEGLTAAKKHGADLAVLQRTAERFLDIFVEVLQRSGVVRFVIDRKIDDELIDLSVRIAELAMDLVSVEKLAAFEKVVGNIRKRFYDYSAGNVFRKNRIYSNLDKSKNGLTQQELANVNRIVAELDLEIKRATRHKEVLSNVAAKTGVDASALLPSLDAYLKKLQAAHAKLLPVSRNVAAVAGETKKTESSVASPAKPKLVEQSDRLLMKALAEMAAGKVELGKIHFNSYLSELVANREFSKAAVAYVALAERQKGYERGVSYESGAEYYDRAGLTGKAFELRALAADIFADIGRAQLTSSMLMRAIKLLKMAPAGLNIAVADKIKALEVLASLVEKERAALDGLLKGLNPQITGMERGVLLSEASEHGKKSGVRKFLSAGARSKFDQLVELLDRVEKLAPQSKHDAQENSPAPVEESPVVDVRSERVLQKPTSAIDPVRLAEANELLALARSNDYQQGTCQLQKLHDAAWLFVHANEFTTAGLVFGEHASSVSGRIAIELAEIQAWKDSPQKYAAVYEAILLAFDSLERAAELGVSETELQAVSTLLTLQVRKISQSLGLYDVVIKNIEKDYLEFFADLQAVDSTIFSLESQKIILDLIFRVRMFGDYHIELLRGSASEAAEELKQSKKPVTPKQEAPVSVEKKALYDELMASFTGKKMQSFELVMILRSDARFETFKATFPQDAQAKLDQLRSLYKEIFNR